MSNKEGSGQAMLQQLSWLELLGPPYPFSRLVVPVPAGSPPPSKPGLAAELAPLALPMRREDANVPASSVTEGLKERVHALAGQVFPPGRADREPYR